MTLSRDANIKHSKERVVVTISSKYPIITIPCFVLNFIIWIVAGGFGLISVAGYISPETLILSVRIFIGFWTVLWLIGGGFFLWSSFLLAFSTAEIIASKEGVSIYRSSPFGAAFKKYSWERIEYITEYITEGTSYGGVILSVGDRVITIDRRLPNRSAKLMADALASYYP